jgi:hypothetical protein
MITSAFKNSTPVGINIIAKTEIMKVKIKENQSVLDVV